MNIKILSLYKCVRNCFKWKKRKIMKWNKGEITWTLNLKIWVQNFDKTHRVVSQCMQLVDHRREDRLSFSIHQNSWMVLNWIEVRCYGYLSLRFHIPKSDNKVLFLYLHIGHYSCRFRIDNCTVAKVIFWLNYSYCFTISYSMLLKNCKSHCIIPIVEKNCHSKILLILFCFDFSFNYSYE